MVGVVRNSPKLHLHQKPKFAGSFGHDEVTFSLQFPGLHFHDRGSDLLELVRTGASRESTKPSE